MADSLLFDRSDDYRQFSQGDVAGSGALSAAVIWMPLSGSSGNFRWMMTRGNDAANGAVAGLSSSDSPAIYDGSNTRTPVGDPGISVDLWWLIGMSKASGTVTPRFHIYDYAEVSWNHVAASGSFVNLAAWTGGVGINRSAAEYAGGNLLIAGVWDSELSDADFETLPFEFGSWVDLAPDFGARFDTAGTITPFSGSSTQTGQTGGVLDSGVAPSGWTDEIVAIQTLRPDADVDAGTWATTPLWSKIDEETADGTVITETT